MGWPPARCPDLNHQWPAEGPYYARSALGSTWRGGAWCPEARDTAPTGVERPPAASLRGREGHTRLPRRDALAARAAEHASWGGRSSRRAYNEEGTLAAGSAEHTSCGGRSSRASRLLTLVPRDYPQGSGPRRRTVSLAPVIRSRRRPSGRTEAREG